MPNSSSSLCTKHGRDARVTLAPFAAGCIAVFVLTFGAAAQSVVELVNNQPFDIRMPLKVRGLKLDVPAGVTITQQVGDDAVVMVEVPASGSRTLTLQQGTGALNPRV